MKIKQTKTPSNKTWLEVPYGGVVALESFSGIWLKLDDDRGVDLTDGVTHVMPSHAKVDFYYPNATLDLGDAA